MPNWQRWKGIMKCYPFEEKRLAKWNPPYIVQPKYDGFRCKAIPVSVDADRNKYLLLSSEENIFYSVPHLNTILGNLGLRGELDGELYYHGATFEELSSILSRTVNIHPDHESIQFHVFDIVNDQSQMKRLLQLEELKDLSPWIKVAPFWICESLDDVMRAYDSIIERGYEGIIVRHCGAPYVKKRSIYVMKFKPKKEDEYEITGFQEEVSIEGIPKGALGSLWCKSGDESDFSVGTGYSRDQREELWKVRDSLAGSTAKVQYQHLTSNKVPRFPVFVEILEPGH